MIQVDVSWSHIQVYVYRSIIHRTPSSLCFLVIIIKYTFKFIFLGHLFRTPSSLCFMVTIIENTFKFMFQFHQFGSVRKGKFRGTQHKGRTSALKSSQLNFGQDSTKIVLQSTESWPISEFLKDFIFFLFILPKIS